MNPQRINVGLICPLPPPPTSKSMSGLQKGARGVFENNPGHHLGPKKWTN
jgi:hypothetical protein